jgi:hypothetical protein
MADFTSADGSRCLYRLVSWGGKDAREEAAAFRQRADQFAGFGARQRDLLTEVALAELARDCGPRQLRRMEQSAVVLEGIAERDGVVAGELESWLDEVSRAEAADLVASLFAAAEVA